MFTLNLQRSGALVLIAAALTGCATHAPTGSVYGTNEVGREQSVRLAVVESVRGVTIEPQRTGVGAVAGGVVGGIVGASAGRGAGGTILGVLGAVGGGLAGDAIERSGNRANGVEITVRLENGELRAITQSINPSEAPFKQGDRVRLLFAGGTTRVSH